MTGVFFLATALGTAWAQATIDVGTPSNALTTTQTTATFPVTITRSSSTAMLGFSVAFTVSGSLTLPAGNSSITIGPFLAASGANTNLQVQDLGGGQYVADGITLGSPCGSTALSGTLFNVAVASSAPAATGTITITSVILRDCTNATLASVIGSAGSVTVDNTLPVVAVSSPNGGEVWVAGSSHDITWTATDAEGFGPTAVDLEWSGNSGGSWSPVASGIANSGTFNWTVPATSTLTALVRATVRDLNNNTATDASAAVFTIQGTTTTTLASAPNPSVVGQSVALTATVAPAAATGSVEFFDGVTSLGTATLAAGSAVLNTSALALGGHSLTTVYAGDAGYTGSTSAVHAHTVNQASTTTTATSTPNPSLVGESVALTATVAVTAPGSGTATGNVEFFDGVTSLGTVALSAGSAVLNTSSLAVGAHSITAVYAGNADFAGSTSAVHAHTVNQAATTTAATSAPNPSLVGESVALTATVAVTAPGAGTAAGNVEFFDGVTSLGTVALSAGSAVLNTASLAVGAHSITAVYAGNADFTGSTSAVHAHTVNQAATTTTVTSSPNPSLVGQSTALTATVAVTAPGAGTATGNVEFFDGVTSLGTVALSAGSAVLNTSSLAVGAHSITAVYAGDANFTGGTSAVHAHAVNQAATTTTVTSAPNPSLVGESVALTATVAVTAPGAGTAAGNVEFFDGVTSLGTLALSAGSAVLNTASLAVGAHSITAVYAGNADFTGSTSAVHAHTVNQAATTTTVTSSPNPSLVGQSTALTATVAVTAPGAGTATGNVEFFDGVTSLGTVALSAGSAVLNTASLAVGPHSITAVYAGDADFTGSTSAAHSHTVSVTASTTTLSSAPNPSVVGQSVALTATVSPGSATGTVEFFDGVTSLGTVAVSGGSAVLNTSSLAVGAHSLTATYGGDASFTGSTSPNQAHTVNQAATTTTTTSSPNPSLVGQSVAVTATVAVTSPGAGTAAGNVEFFDGVTSLGIVALSAGSAVLNTSSLAVGAHSLTAVYAGDANFTGSTSAVHSHTVNQAASTTSATSSPNPSVVGESVALTANVAVNPPGAGTATGNVEFFDGVTSLGIVALSAGSAVLNTSSLAVGAHSITAVYAGDANFTGSTSAVHAHTVNQAASTTTATSSPNPSVAGQSVALTANVAVNPPGAGTATGNVEFFDGVTSLGTVALSAGSAVLNTASLAVGPHSITAVYAGDANFTGSTSAIHAHTVNQAATSTLLSSGPNPSTFGTNVALSASVAVTPPGAGAATGSVEFFDGVTSLGAPQPLVAGSAGLNTSALTAGSHSITAVYSGDASFAGSTSNTVIQVVNAAGTSVSLAATPDPGVYLEAETLTATVAPATATGSVEFFDGVTSLGSGALSGGTAVLVTSSLSVGVHSLTAQYPGDANHGAATSAAVSREVKAKLVATAGTNGSITPSGTVLVSLNATPSFTFAADPGYHVSSVTVDGGGVALTSPYTFAAVSSNHTIDVLFEVNPPVAAISTLASTTLRTGNGTSGVMRIRVDWTAVPVGSTVQVWRAAFGNSPEYNDSPSPGSIPAPPSYPPGAPWTLTAVTTPAGEDLPPVRDFYYYVAFVTDGFGTVSPVSNPTAGSLAYALGDVTDGVTPGQGDNSIGNEDISLLGSVYGRVLTPGDAFNYLDVGPTTDLSVHARPTTDNLVNFEDLVMFGMNFGEVSAPASAATPVAADRDELRLEAPELPAVGSEYKVRLMMLGTGSVHALSAALSWDPFVVEPVGQEPGEMLASQRGLSFSPAPGQVDMVILGDELPGLTGDGTLATVKFRVLRAGSPRLAITRVDARDVANRHVAVTPAGPRPGVPVYVTGLAHAAPTPFRDRTSLVFTLATRGAVELAIFSVDGRRVRTMASGVHEPGEYRLQWDGRDDSGHRSAVGAYYIRLVSPQGRFTRKLTYLR